MIRAPQQKTIRVFQEDYNGMKRIQITIVIVFLEIAKSVVRLNTLQECIIKQNPEVNWTKQVMWHQWQSILVDTGEKDSKKK